MLKRENKVELFKLSLLVVFLSVTIFVRFFNLEKTTRFTRDESSNLYDMHNIFIKKQITLVGPIDVTRTIIYPSLTFYMLLPFSILGNFEPVSPAYGTAFYGVLTAILLIVLTRKINKKFLFLVSILAIIWFPLVESSRWAWNPHLVPFISALAILFFLFPSKWSRLVSGIFFGLTFHLHYVAIVSFLVFALTTSLISFYKRKFREGLLLPLGFVLTIIPFVIFDIKNPPGLFFGRFLTNNLVTGNFGGTAPLFFITFPQNIGRVLEFLTQSVPLAFLLGGVLLTLLTRDLIKKRYSLIFFFPALFQTAAISFLPNFQTRYFLLGIIFFFVWLIYPRQKFDLNLSKIALLVMIIGSLLSLRGLLTQPTSQPDTYTIRLVSDFIKKDISEKNRKNVNIAALASPDRDPFGIVFRHVLDIKGVKLLLENEYTITDNLFVVTTSDESIVRDDAANIMNGFRKGPIRETFFVDNNGWRIHLFNRDPR